MTAIVAVHMHLSKYLLNVSLKCFSLAFFSMRCPSKKESTVLCTSGKKEVVDINEHDVIDTLRNVVLIKRNIDTTDCCYISSLDKLSAFLSVSGKDVDFIALFSNMFERY